MSYVVPILIGLLYALLMSLVREPHRRRLNAVVVAGAGAAYLSGGGLGGWELAFTVVATYVAYRGLDSWTFIGIGWLLHTAWDVVHHIKGNPIVPSFHDSSLGCAICDPVIALWCLGGGPTPRELLRRARGGPRVSRGGTARWRSTAGRPGSRTAPSEAMSFAGAAGQPCRNPTMRSRRMTAPTFDLGAQTRIVARLADGVTDAQLSAATPCPDLAVRNLLGHLTGLAIAFRDAARKDLGVTTDTSPEGAVPDIGPGWREELPKVLDELADAWRDPAAWTGMTRAGGVDLPGEVAAGVVADELVIHGWDLARATGQRYEPDPAALRASYDMLFAAARDSDRGDGIFGPVVPVPDEAPLLDRAVGLSGRDPGWKP